MNQKKALIGLSGGVDSSTAAWLAMEQGLLCEGGTMILHSSACGGADNVADAESVARRLGIPFHVFDFRKEFAQTVMADFVASYENGMTPNPCILCNRVMKFDAMLKAALSLGCEYVVSGHYARICKDAETGRYLLYKAADVAKDQTYFLASLNQYQLSHILFPLGELTKQQVREIAQAQGFVTAHKRESQDICFVPDGDYVSFMEGYTGKTYAPGDYLNTEGKIVGQHKGAVCYTLGQRKGLGIALGAPVYVCAKDMHRNTVTVGPNEALFKPALRAANWNWIPFPALTAPLAVTAKIRHSQFDQPAVVYPEENGYARVVFENPQRAITPGQAVVLYQGDLVIGSGTITESLTL